MQIMKRALLLTGLLGFSILALPRLRGSEVLLELIRVEGRVPVPMRDGVKLYADIYRPRREGNFRCSWFGRPMACSATGCTNPKIRFAQRGYAVVIQDTRGRYESEGKWEPFRNEAEDGYDTIQWAAQQPWSNGKVATEGGSYLGHVQWRAASLAPPNLVTIFPQFVSPAFITTGPISAEPFGCRSTTAGAPCACRNASCCRNSGTMPLSLPKSGNTRTFSGIFP